MECEQDWIMFHRTSIAGNATRHDDQTDLKARCEVWQSPWNRDTCGLQWGFSYSCYCQEPVQDFTDQGYRSDTQKLKELATYCGYDISQNSPKLQEGC
jgi:hypothetical protein